MMEQVPALNQERIRTETPEAQLWRAVIDQAIADLSDPDFGQAAVEWFTSVSEQPGTFRWVCEHLNLSASAVCSALAQRKDRKNPPKLLLSAAASKRPKRERWGSAYSRRENRFAARF
jgi:hypothetical protein